MRDVGEQLAPRTVGCGERRGAGAEVVGHPVERGCKRADFVAAAFDRAHVGPAFTERAGRMLERAQPPVRRTEDQERRARRANREQHQPDPGQRRPELSNRDKHWRWVDRDDHDADLSIRDDDRRGRRSTSRRARSTAGVRLWRREPR